MGALDDMTSLLCSVGLGIVVTGICPLLIDDYAGQIGFAILFGFYSGYWTTFLQQATRELADMPMHEIRNPAVPKSVPKYMA
jgi:hypothetical protein